jgi:hypothetical protein
MGIRILLFLSLLASGLQAQVSTVSPYSSQGIGDVNFYGDAYFMGLGGSSVSVIDSSQANLFNAASYSFAARGLPIFSMGLAHEETTFLLNDQRGNDRFTNITHFSLIIPFGNRWGMSMGLSPLSRSGYTIQSFQIIGGDSIFYDFTGKGEIQKANLGLSLLMANSLNHKFSLGINGFRYFGRLERERRASQTNALGGESGGLERQFLRAKDFGFDAGFIYRYSPSNKHLLTLGGTYQLEQGVQFTKSAFDMYFGEINNPLTYDTLNPLTNFEGKINLPQKLKVGFSYEYKTQRDTLSRGGSRRSSSLLITGEYGAEDWSSYSEDFAGFPSTPTAFFDMTSLRFGIQYRPHRYIAERSDFVKGMAKWSYRVGGYMVETPNRLGQDQVQDMGITMGIGIPIVLSNAVSSINISASYGQRGVSLDAESYRERYLGINFGLNIVPSYDRWFKKYELN